MSIAESLLTPDRRVGVLVPSANPTVEPELRFLLPETVGMFVARFPVMPGTDLEQRNNAYLDLYAPTLQSFGSIALDAALVGLTGPSYRLLPDGDAAHCKELTTAAGRPVATASLAIGEALSAVGAARIALVSPYPEWLTQKAVSFWQARGHEVVQTVIMPGEFRAYQLTTDELAGALGRVEAAGCDAVVMSGTGMLTIPACLRMVADFAQPLLSSNLCSAWWLLRALDLPPGENLMRCAPVLCRTLPRA